MRVIIEKEWDSITADETNHHTKGYSKLIIRTLGGSFEVTGCNQCHAVFLNRIDDNED